MTSKNTLIAIEKITPISVCRIAWRLRCVICILIFFTAILLSVQTSYSQEFSVVNDASFYPSSSAGSYIPQSADNKYAVLVWTVSPVSGGNVTTADIVPSYYHKQGDTNGQFGWYFTDIVTDTRTWYTVIDSSSMYIRTDSISSRFPSQILEILQAKNLGTVDQRRNLILLLNNSKSIVTPSDFRSFIQPWIVSGLVIAILIPAWYLMRRFLRG